MGVTLVTVDGCRCEISPEFAAKSEFIQGAIEDSTTTNVILKLSHQSCTLHTIQRVVHLLTQYLNMPATAGFDDAVQRIAVTNFVDLCDEEVLDIVIASDVLDIQGMRELLGKRPGTLHVASRLDSPHAIRALLEGKSSIEARDIDSRTPLHCAAALGNIESLSVLLEASAVVNVHDRFQQSPLHLAASSGQIAVVDKLLSASARPDTIDWCRQTPMHLAAAAGRDSVLTALIRCKAKIDAEDGIGQTPLHLCAASGKTTTARVLVEQGVRTESYPSFEPPMFLKKCMTTVSVFRRTNMLETWAETPLRISVKILPVGNCCCHRFEVKESDFISTHTHITSG
jgi:hypothetical protein